jgi:hypothetical protein
MVWWLRVVPLAFQAFLMGGIKNPISAVLRSGWGHICLGQDICGRNHTAVRTKITRAASNRDLYAECRSFVPTARASRKNKNKNKPLIQYQLCILTFSVYMCIQRIEKFLLFESMFQP